MSWVAKKLKARIGKHTPSSATRSHTSESPLPTRLAGDKIQSAQVIGHVESLASGSSSIQDVDKANYPSHSNTPLDASHRDVANYGLTVLYEPPSGTKVLSDIVFIHGLTGHPFNTWLEKDLKTFWPRDLLAKDVKDCRILTYGYDADVTKFFGPVSQADFRGRAEALLGDLADLRTADSSETRGLIFVVHSLGGLVLKKALCLSEVSFEKRYKQAHCYTTAIVFMGTPHKGSSLSSYAKTLAQISKALFRRTNASLVKLLETKSPELADVEESFGIWLRKKGVDVNISCFYEELELPFVGQVVTKDSAKLIGYTSRPIHANHTEMTKFNSSTDTGYKRVLSEINRSLKPLRTEAVSLAALTEDAKACLRSLSFPEMHFRENDIRKPIEGTCAWLSENEVYGNWVDERHELLWIKGKPGSGKTTALKHLVGNRQKRASETTVVAFFFHGQGAPIQKSANGLYRAILHQLLQQVPELLLALCARFKHKRDTRGVQEWQTRELEDFLSTNVIDASKIHPMEIYVDALDECGEEIALEILSFFQDLMEEAKKKDTEFKICFSCRHYPIISSGGGLEIRIDQKTTDDIHTYVKHRLKYNINDIRAHDLEDLEKELVSRSENVFLWVDLVTARIIQLQRRGESHTRLREEVKKIQPKLKDLYREPLEGVPEEERPQTLRLMQWIGFAFRPLSVGELRYAIAIDINTPCRSLRECKAAGTLVETNSQMENKIKHLCKGLAEVREHNGESIVQFIHQSVIDSGLETLNGSSAVSVIGSAHFHLSRSCLTYLDMEESYHMASVLSEFSSSRTANAPNNNRLPALSTSDNDLFFMDYATEFWTRHTEVVEDSGIAQGDLVQYMSLPYSATIELWSSLWSWRLGRLPPDWAQVREISKGMTTFHTVCSLGILSAMESALRTKVIDPDLKDEGNRTPLWHAAENGHEKVVKALMVRDDVSVNAKDKSGRTPLLIATSRGNREVVKLLLSLDDIDANPRDRDEWTPLSIAAVENHTEMVKLLLAHKDVDVDSRNRHGESPLSLSTMYTEHEEIAQLLLARKEININSRYRYGDSLLSIAVRWGRKNIVKLLLAHKNIDVNSRNSSGIAVLHYAVSYKAGDAMEALLAHENIQVNVLDCRGQTPLMWAVLNDYTFAVKTLIARGDVNLNATDDFGATALGYARSGDVQSNYQPFVEGIELLEAALRKRDIEERPSAHIPRSRPSSSLEEWGGSEESMECNDGLTSSDEDDIEPFSSSNLNSDIELGQASLNKL
ncbi:MAG: hypothetical protein MMC33_007191 [Icmadophila ericetorum]|nr:hypothetical protein [Icmadophila ericetorum]